MRLFLILFLAVMLLASCVWAQEDNVTTATVALQDVLSNLKESVEKLSLDNDQLTARDTAIKKEVLQLQMQLGEIVAQGDLLNRTADKLQDKNPGRAQQIARLEDENYDLDNRTQKAEGGIKLTQQSLNAAYQEVQQLLMQLKGMKNVLPSASVGSSPQVQIAAHRQKEKLKLMKMIYDSQLRQEALHESILEFQKNTPLLPGAAALAHQQLLKEQIKDLETQIAANSPGKPGFSEEAGIQSRDRAFWDDTQLGQLEEELKVLEKNYSQLKDLTGLMSKRAQNVRMTVSEHIEEDKLQRSLDDLNHQGEGLKSDLDDLRAQMIDLDKRKTRLETMVQQ